MLDARHAAILEKLEKYGNVTVKELSLQLRVTEKTIRQDLCKLEKKGVLKRVHGGAVINIESEIESAYSSTIRTVALHEKEKIARAAFDYLKTINANRNIIFLDAGTTNYELSRYLKTSLYNTIITNDLMIASNLTNLGSHLHITGGALALNVNKSLVGADAIDMIKKHHSSICFIGTSSVHSKLGFMTHTNEDAEIKRAIIEHSSLVVCLADHNKFEKNSFVQFADVNDIDVIITDSKTPPEQINYYRNLGVHIIIAEE